MIADSPEMIAAMKQMRRPASHATHSRFTEVKPRERLVLTTDSTLYDAERAGRNPTRVALPSRIFHEPFLNSMRIGHHGMVWFDR